MPSKRLIVGVLFCLFVMAVLIAFDLYWATNQAISFHTVEQKVQTGMTVGQVERALRVPTGSLSRRIRPISYPPPAGTAGYTLNVTQEGIGRWLETQWRVSLILAPDRRVVYGQAGLFHGLEHGWFMLRLMRARSASSTLRSPDSDQIARAWGWDDRNTVLSNFGVH